jgi:hypothetical protein
MLQYKSEALILLEDGEQGTSNCTLTQSEEFSIT